MSFADQLRDERKRLGLTQAVADAVLDTCKGQVAAWESGRNTPHVLTQEGALERLRNRKTPPLADFFCASASSPCNHTMKPHKQTLLPLSGRYSIGTARGIARATTVWAVGLWAITVLLIAAAVLARIALGDARNGIYIVATVSAFALVAFIAALRFSALAVEDWEFVARLLEVKDNWMG